MIAVRRADLAAAAVDAVLRPVTAEWTAPNPAMRRLELAAGPDVEARCRDLGDLPVGSAVVTPAGDLAATYLIHVVIRSWDQPSSPGVVQRALRNGLRRVGEWGVRTLALPPLGTGAGNLDAEESADLMVPILVEYLRTASPAPHVEIVVDSEYEHDAFTGALRRNGIEAAVPPTADDPSAIGNPEAGST